MGSQVRVLYCPPSSRTKKDIYAKNPEVSTASGFFCAHFLKLEKKISKRVLAKSVDLNLYPRDFGPLFREFFRKAALFCSRQNVEFRPAFLLVLPNTHSKHRYQRVSQLCDVSDVKTAGKPPPPVPGRNHSVLAMLGREKAKHPLPAPPQDCEKNSSASTADRPPNVQTYSSAQNRTQTAPGRQFRGIPASGCPDDFLPCFHSPFRLPIFQYTHIPHFCLFLTQICFHTKIEKPLTTLSFVRSLLFC